jgi:hypothetical protein
MCPALGNIGIHISKLELMRWSKYLHTVYHANFSHINLIYLIYPKKIILLIDLLYLQMNVGGSGRPVR